MKKVFTVVMTSALCLSLLVVGASLAHAQTAASAGCAPGAMYSTTSGAPCPGTSASMGMTAGTVGGNTTSGSMTNTSSAGCMPGYMYNTTTGALCGTSTGTTGATTVAGCMPGYMYSTVNGALCPMTSIGNTTPGFPNTGVMPVSNIAILGATSVALALGAFYLTKRALSY